MATKYQDPEDPKMKGNPSPTERTAAVQSEAIRIMAVVLFYFFISISLVFLNKNIMTEDFEFPLFITWFQLVVALFCSGMLGYMGKFIPSLSMMPPMEFDLRVAQKILPLAIVFVGMISFNNLCLLYVEVTFYQVARSTTICFTIIFSYLILKQSTSWPAVRASLVVMFGFIIGSYGEINFSVIGTVFGVISSCFVSLYGIFVKKVMPVVGGDQWRLLIYNTILSMLLMFPLIVITGESTRLRDCPLLMESSTWVSMTITGIFGFILNIAVFLLIKVTSPLTNNIAGTLKACVQTLLAMVVYRNPISLMNGTGIVLVILGSFWYSQVRYNEMKNAPKPAETSVERAFDWMNDREFDIKGQPKEVKEQIKTVLMLSLLDQESRRPLHPYAGVWRLPKIALFRIFHYLRR
jgi:GDP-fucose transporter C1